jgi:hypothetical protein
MDLFKARCALVVSDINGALLSSAFVCKVSDQFFMSAVEFTQAEVLI